MAESGTRLDRLRAQAHAIAGEVGLGPVAAGRLRQMLGALNLWFWGIVGLPTLIAGVYYFGIASNLYMSKTQFLIRSPKVVQTSPLGALLQSTGISRSGDDGAAVSDFIMSRDAVRKLERRDDLRAIFDRPEADFVTRFPGPFGRSDFEALYAHYKRFVTVENDGTTGITTLRVEAYRPQDARMLAQALLDYSQHLINHLNERARRDALDLARREVARIETRLSNVQTKLTAYRVRQKMINPRTASAGVLQLIQQMSAAEANARAQLSQLLRTSPSSPQITLVRTRIRSLASLIERERAKLSGQTNSVVSTMDEYEHLKLEQGLAQKELASAFTSLEQARIEAQRQQVYLEAVAHPNLPDYPLYPKRVMDFVMVVASCLVAYALAWLLVASVREHQAA